MADVTVLSLFEVVIDYGEAPEDPIIGWEVVGGPDGVPVTVNSFLDEGSGLYYLLITGMMPGYAYYVVPDLGDGFKLTAIDFDIPAEAPFLDYSAFPLPYPAKLLEALTFAMGKEAQHTNGTSCTHLLGNYSANETSFYVKSTLDFPPYGTIRVLNRRFTYTSKTANSFDGLSGDFTAFNLPKGAKVFLVTREILPRQTGYPVSPRYTSTPRSVENHYLQFNGTTDFAYALNGALGYLTEYMVLVKAADQAPTSAGWPCIAHLNNSAVAFPGSLMGWMQHKNASPIDYRHGGLTPSGTFNFDHESGVLGQTSGPQLYAIGRNHATSTARARVIKSTDGSIFWGPADAAAAQDSSPTDICVGAFLTDDLTFSSGPCALKLVAVCFLVSIPTDAQLQAYALSSCKDARAIFGTSLYGYYTASMLVGSSIMNLGRSPLAVPLTLVGPTAADLVAL